LRHDTEKFLAMISLFQRILGDGFVQLPAPVRRVHGLSRDLATAGRADITTAPGLLPWLLCRLAGLPRPGSDVPVTVSFHPDGRGGEYWRRRFADRRYASSFAVGDRSREDLLIEKFFPFRLHYRLTASPEGLAWRLVEWRLCGITLPRRTLPAVNCLESADGDRFRFDIDVVFPIVGPVIHYRGWLMPIESAEGD
jgi:hypothetical protein